MTDGWLKLDFVKEIILVRPMGISATSASSQSVRCIIAWDVESIQPVKMYFLFPSGNGILYLSFSSGERGVSSPCIHHRLRSSILPTITIIPFTWKADSECGPDPQWWVHWAKPHKSSRLRPTCSSLWRSYNSKILSHWLITLHQAFSLAHF